RKSPSSVQIFYPKFNKDELIQIIRERLDDLNKKLPLLLVILFGSYAKGSYTVASDADLLVVYGGKERKDAYATVKRTLRVPRLEPHVYSHSEYEKMKKVVNKMTKDGVVLFAT
ncbi:unnamed protein product, partial [marine sediment metagenome]